MSVSDDPFRWRVGLVGYGEVGQILAEDLRGKGVAVAMYDLKLGTDAGARMRRGGIEEPQYRDPWSGCVSTQFGRAND